VKSVAELIAYAKARPGQLNFASAGIGTSPQMSIELFKSMAGIDMVHIPYKGTAPGVVDLLAGQVLVMAPNLLTALPHIKSGKLRALAVTSAKDRSLPEVRRRRGGRAGLRLDAMVRRARPRGNAAADRGAPARRDRARPARRRGRQAPRRGRRRGGRQQPGGVRRVHQVGSEKWAKVASAAGIKPE